MTRAIGTAAVLTAAMAIVSTAAAQTPAAQDAQGAPLTLDAALARAMEANRAIVAARLARRVSEAGIGVARERPNPELTYEAERELPHQSIGATFPIEVGGKRRQRIDLARASVTTADAELAELIAEVRSDVRRAYFSLAAAEERAGLSADVRALALRARDAAQARFAAGDVPRLEAVQTELALADADNDVSAARGDAEAARAELNVLLGQPPSAPIRLADAPGATPVPSLDDAVRQAERSNARLLLLDRRIEEQVIRRNLARALQTPDFSAGTALVYDAQPEFSYGWRLSAGVTLPLFTRHRAAVQVEDATLTQLRAEREAAGAEVVAGVAAALARASALADQLARYEREILPRATEVEQMAQDGYAAGQTGLVTLLQALQSTRDVRRRGLQAALDFQLAMADLEHAIGAPIVR